MEEEASAATKIAESEQEQPVTKKSVGNFHVFLEKHTDQVKQKQSHWNNSEIKDFLMTQWQEMSDEQKACYVTENSTGDDRNGTASNLYEEAIKEFNSVLHSLIYKRYPIIGLDYISVQKTGTDKDEPSYNCTLCDINFGLSLVSTHVLGTRHKLAYLKIMNPTNFKKIVGRMKKKGTRKPDIIRSLIGEAKKLESTFGRGEIKINKKYVPSLVSNHSAQAKNRNTGPVRKRPRDNWNSSRSMMRNKTLLNPPYPEPYPEPPFQEFYPQDMPYESYPQDMPSYDDYNYYKKMSPMQKLDLIQELADTMISTAAEAHIANDILNAISKKMFQYRVLNLSPAETSALNKTLDTGDLTPLHNRKGQSTPKNYNRSGSSQQNSNWHGIKGGPLLPSPSSYSIRNLQSTQSGSNSERDPFLIGGYSTEYKF